ncbi:hypothetical protein HPB48_003001 [Haemaphysalis longicornis]|uniref:Uncharacterized protein n=1 Tax=Haemaphysalis longicornis TaxID=44386 RepID=A0A9J6FDZ4_HAELO|nr:hypothetical protein HPB48_003001 [Haemaphysalis longicornis]
MDDNQNSQRKQAKQCARRNAPKCPRSRSTENKAVWRDHFGEARKLLRGRATAEREEDAVEAPTAATSSAELVPCCCALSVGLSSGTAFALASHLSRTRGSYRVAIRKTKLCPPSAVFSRARLRRLELRLLGARKATGGTTAQRLLQWFFRADGREARQHLVKACRYRDSPPGAAK